MLGLPWLHWPESGQRWGDAFLGFFLQGHLMASDGGQAWQDILRERVRFCPEPAWPQVPMLVAHQGPSGTASGLPKSIHTWAGLCRVEGQREEPCRKWPGWAWFVGTAKLFDPPAPPPSIQVPSGTASGWGRGLERPLQVVVCHYTHENNCFVKWPRCLDVTKSHITSKTSNKKLG